MLPFNESSFYFKIHSPSNISPSNTIHVLGTVNIPMFCDPTIVFVMLLVSSPPPLQVYSR